MTGGAACPRSYPATALCGRCHLCCCPLPASRAAIGVGEGDGAHPGSTAFNTSKKCHALTICPVMPYNTVLPPTVSDPSNRSIRLTSCVLLPPASRAAIGMGERDGADPPSTALTLVKNNDATNSDCPPLEYSSPSPPSTASVPRPALHTHGTVARDVEPVPMDAPCPFPTLMPPETGEPCHTQPDERQERERASFTLPPHHPAPPAAAARTTTVELPTWRFPARPPLSRPGSTATS